MMALPTNPAPAGFSAVYSQGEVARLLAAWSMLSDGKLPRRTATAPGYRGKVASEEAPWAHVVRMKVDLETAITQLPDHLKRSVFNRFWMGRRTHQSKEALMQAVWREMNGATSAAS